MGIIKIKYLKDLYYTTRISWKVRGFFCVSHAADFDFLSEEVVSEDLVGSFHFSP